MTEQTIMQVPVAPVYVYILAVVIPAMVAYIAYRLGDRHRRRHYGHHRQGHYAADYPLQAAICQTYEDDLIIRGNGQAIEAWVKRGHTGRTGVWK